MSWWLILVILLPLLFVVGVVYNSIKAQKKLEREMLPELIKEREAERERMRRQGLISLNSNWDEDDDWPEQKLGSAAGAEPEQKVKNAAAQQLSSLSQEVLQEQKQAAQMPEGRPESELQSKGQSEALTMLDALLQEIEAQSAENSADAAAKDGKDKSANA